MVGRYLFLDEIQSVYSFYRRFSKAERNIVLLRPRGSSHICFEGLIETLVVVQLRVFYFTS